MAGKRAKAHGWTRELLLQLVEDVEAYGIFASDKDGIVVSWNKGAEKIFGFAADEAIGMDADRLFTQEDRLAGVPENERQTAVEKGFAEDERWHLRKGGSLFFASGIQTALCDDSGEVTGFAKITRDLTERVELQHELNTARTEMEIKVVERTDELHRTNHALRLEVIERKRAEELRASMIRKIVATQESERKRIARDLHDQIGQQMTALKFRLNTLAGRAGSEVISEDLAEIQAMANRIDDEIDFLAWELRPSVLDDLGLPVAVKKFVNDWSMHFKIEGDFQEIGMRDGRVLPEIEINLYRIIQEALNNTAKHARATRASVLLERSDRSIRLVVEDDGSGFDSEKLQVNRVSHRGMGLMGMRERAELLGGNFDVESTPGQGTAVFVRVPITAPSIETDGDHGGG